MSNAYYDILDELERVIAANRQAKTHQTSAGLAVRKAYSLVLDVMNEHGWATLRLEYDERDKG